MERAVVELVYKFNEKSTVSVFEKVSQPLKCHSNFFFVVIYIYILIYTDTSPDHITPACACVCRIMIVLTGFV